MRGGLHPSDLRRAARRDGWWGLVYLRHSNGDRRHVPESCTEAAGRGESEGDQRLREYTFALEDQPVDQWENEPLSHRSDLSDIERQAQFLERKLVAEQEAQLRDPRSRALVFPRLPGSEATDELKEKYRALGINVEDWKGI